MKPAKLYVSATRPDGSFEVRGMASPSKALEIFRSFRDARPGGKAFFAVFSQHDGRLRLRPSTADLFEAEVVASAARKPALWGWLPAKPEIVLRSLTFSDVDAERVITALYQFTRPQFVHLVKQEIEG